MKCQSKEESNKDCETHWIQDGVKLVRSVISEIPSGFLQQYSDQDLCDITEGAISVGYYCGEENAEGLAIFLLIHAQEDYAPVSEEVLLILHRKEYEMRIPRTLEPTISEPTPDEVQDDLDNADMCQATDGCYVSTDVPCKHGHISWVRYWEIFGHGEGVKEA